jgi:queuosine precursor transporter
MTPPLRDSVVSDAANAGGSLLSVFTGIFVAVLVLCSVANAKIFAVGSLTMPGSTILFPLVFVFNDILTEVYGYARSRLVIWTGLGCQCFAALTFLIIDKLPPAPFWGYQEGYHQLLGLVPRFAFAGLVAYFCGEFVNSFVLSKMKYRHQGERGRKLSWRFVVSTVAGEAVDSTLFMTAAFGGVISWANLFRTALTLYIVKVLYEIVILPVHTRIANWVKDIEHIDRIDAPETTDYNPFANFIRSDNAAA